MHEDVCKLGIEDAWKLGTSNVQSTLHEVGFDTRMHM